MDSVDAGVPNCNHKIPGFDLKPDGTVFADADVNNHGLSALSDYKTESIL